MLAQSESGESEKEDTRLNRVWWIFGVLFVAGIAFVVNLQPVWDIREWSALVAGSVAVGIVFVIVFRPSAREKVYQQCVLPNADDTDQALEAIRFLRRGGVHDACWFLRRMLKEQDEGKLFRAASILAFFGRDVYEKIGEAMRGSTISPTHAQALAVTIRNIGVQKDTRTIQILIHLVRDLFNDPDVRRRRAAFIASQALPNDIARCCLHQAAQGEADVDFRQTLRAELARRGGSPTTQILFTFSV